MSTGEPDALFLYNVNQKPHKHFLKENLQDRISDTMQHISNSHCNRYQIPHIQVNKPYKLYFLKKSTSEILLRKTQRDN
jgi:hypothetical protein